MTKGNKWAVRTLFKSVFVFPSTSKTPLCLICSCPPTPWSESGTGSGEERATERVMWLPLSPPGSRVVDPDEGSGHVSCSPGSYCPFQQSPDTLFIGCLIDQKLLKIIPPQKNMHVVTKRNLRNLVSQIIWEWAIRILKWLVVIFPKAFYQTLIPVLARGQVKQ